MSSPFLFGPVLSPSNVESAPTSCALTGLEIFHSVARNKCRGISQLLFLVVAPRHPFQERALRVKRSWWWDAEQLYTGFGVNVCRLILLFAHFTYKYRAYIASRFVPEVDELTLFDPI